VKLLEERRTRLSLIVALRGAPGSSEPVTDDVTWGIQNATVSPVLYRLFGYWLFLNLPNGRQKLTWSAKGHEGGEQEVEIGTLPPLRPFVALQAIPRSAGMSVVAPLTIVSASLVAGKVGVAYAQVVAVNGGAPPLLFESTALPAGLTLNPSRGSVTGTPTKPGAKKVTVTITDGKGGRVERSYTLKIVR